MYYCQYTVLWIENSTLVRSPTLNDVGRALSALSASAKELWKWFNRHSTSERSKRPRTLFGPANKQKKNNENKSWFSQFAYVQCLHIYEYIIFLKSILITQTYVFTNKIKWVQSCCILRAKQSRTEQSFP